MKHLIRFLATALFGGVLVLFPGSPLSASAAGDTYNLVYSKSYEEWRFTLGEYSPEAGTIELSHLPLYLQEGDHLTVVGSGPSHPSIEISVDLSSLTYLSPSGPILYVKNVENAYFRNNAYTSIHGKLTNAYVSGTSSVTFNDPVQHLYLLDEPNVEFGVNISSLSTVAHVQRRSATAPVYNLYHVVNQMLRVQNGVLKTSAKYYDAAPSIEDLRAWNQATISLTRNGVDYTAVFDPIFYADTYADLRTAFGYDENALLNHFLTYGMREGRRGNPFFTVSSYRDRYKDLQKAFGDDLPSYYLHYIRYGVSEMRSSG